MSSLREAAAAVMREWDTGVLGYQLDAAFAALKAALAKQEQAEPVALNAELLEALKAIISVDAQSSLTEAEADEITAKARAAIKAAEGQA